MKKTALVIMAAGIGSRFGKGIKQLAPLGPNGEIIMEYSIYDALEAGFNKVVFIIRKDIEEEFREIIGNKIEKVTEVEYALTSPPAPSLIPPKYLTTIHNILVKLFFFKTFKIGNPAVPPGSPSSLHFSLLSTIYE